MNETRFCNKQYVTSLLYMLVVLVCVTWSIDRIVQRHACITWGVGLILAIFFMFFLYVWLTWPLRSLVFFPWLTLSGTAGKTASSASGLLGAIVQTPVAVGQCSGTWNWYLLYMLVVLVM
jgi:hypothetical protein